MISAWEVMKQIRNQLEKETIQGEVFDRKLVIKYFIKFQILYQRILDAKNIIIVKGNLNLSWTITYEPWKVGGFIKVIILFKHNFSIGIITTLSSSVTFD